MARATIYIIFIFSTILGASICVPFDSAAKQKVGKNAETPEGNFKELNYESSVKDIVNDLIENWQSPLVYLKDRGYLPKELQNAPQINYEAMQKNELKSQKVSHKSEAKPMESIDPNSYRTVRGSDDNKNDKDNNNYELKNMFHTLFSSKDNDISDQLRTKLDVPWDMEAMKLSAHEEARKYYEKYINQPLDERPGNPDAAPSEVVEEQVAELYPSVVLPKDMHWDIKNKSLVVSSAYSKKPFFVKGIAKIMGHRDEKDKVLEKKNPKTM